MGGGGRTELKITGGGNTKELKAQVVELALHAAEGTRMTMRGGKKALSHLSTSSANVVRGG